MRKDEWIITIIAETFETNTQFIYNKLKQKNMTITTTTVEQTANTVLGTEAKTLYYLIVKNSNGKQLVINVGKKTHEQVTALNKDEETKTKGGK